MKRRGYVGTMVQAVLVVLLSAVLASGATPAVKRYKMTGTIAAIEADVQTVVVEVPQGKDKLTVGGPLSGKAVLRRGGKSVQLSAFRVGEKATVTWQATAEGHVIERLEAP